jgi:hypothetical protein
MFLLAYDPRAPAHLDGSLTVDGAVICGEVGALAELV